MPRPNGYDCSACEHWDDINGCWANKKDILTCEFFNKLMDENADGDMEDENEV